MKTTGDTGAAGAAPEEVEEADGRRRRSQDSRARIVAALLELIWEGEIAPGAEQVAVRAKVGLRTVFRHFNDMDSLYAEMAHVIQVEVMSVLTQPFKGETWRDRVMELVERRGRAFEKIGPYKRASDINRHRSAFLAQGHARLVTGSREILLRQLPPDIAADPIKLEALDLLLSFEAWNRLRLEQGLSQRRVREVLEAQVRYVIGE